MTTYPVERSFPPYYLEHRARYTEARVTRVPDRPIWVFENLDGGSVNSILVEGTDGLVLFDTGVSHSQGRSIAREIRTLTDKPLLAIVYSHHHGDHCQGTDALVTPDQLANGEVRIFAWQSFDREFVDENRTMGPVMRMRAGFQYGMALPPEEQAYTGLGGQFHGRAGTFVPPTDHISETTELEVGGVRFTLFLTGGEASSEMGMYLPDHHTAVIADELYVSMPNLYTMRGAKFRDAMAWADAGDKVLALDIDVLLGCHMPPIIGRAEIERVLTTYRDAIQFNHDQAVRHILRGATTEDLRTGLVTLPDHLDIDPYTREMYGSVKLNAAQQYVGYLGWFEGDATDLEPTPRKERSRRTIALMGGRGPVLTAAEAALRDSDPQWAAELSSLLVSNDPTDQQARDLKAAALRTIGYREQNALRRNWYLTGAMELEGSIDMAGFTAVTRDAMFSPTVPLTTMLGALRYLVDPDRAGNTGVRCNIATASEVAGAELRHSVLIAPCEPFADPDATLLMDTSTFGRWASGALPWLEARSETCVSIEGDASALEAFIGAFDLSAPTVSFHIR